MILPYGAPWRLGDGMGDADKAQTASPMESIDADRIQHSPPVGKYLFPNREEFGCERWLL